MGHVPTDGKAAEELVPQALALGDRREAAVLDFLGVELKRVLGELEALLDERGELADATALLAEDLLGVGGTDDDLIFSRLKNGPKTRRKIDRPQCARGSHGRRSPSSPPPPARG